MGRQSGVSLSRRDFIGTGLVAGIGTALAGPPAEAQPAGSSLPLITKAVPSSGERLATIGIGTDTFGESARDEIRAELERMSELGASVIDTAAAYGDSEALIGDALESLGIRDKMFIATKLVGASANPFTPSGAASFDRSLERLRTRRVDLLQVHNLNGVAELIPTMQEWKKAGRIRYIGATTSRVGQHGQMLQVMHNYPLDFVQVDYSIANRDAAEAILPFRRGAQDRGVGQPALRARHALAAGRRPEAPALGGRHRRRELGAVLPEVRDLPPGGHLRHPGLDQAESPRG